LVIKLRTAKFGKAMAKLTNFGDFFTQKLLQIQPKGLFLHLLSP